MIDNEVSAILNNETDQAESLNCLVDQFRDGRDPGEILRLLSSEKDELVRIGAWITSEISTDYYNTETFVTCLYDLTNHQIPSVRLYALSALFPLLEPTRQEADDVIVKLLKDSNEGVRETAEAAARALGIVWRREG